MKAKTLKLDEIKIDGGTQPRIAIDEAYVSDLVETLDRYHGVVGAHILPPVIVYDDGAALWLADGFHRFHAHKKANAKTIKADVRTGTRRDAVLYSVGANHTHGLRRTNADKRRAVETLLKDDEWAKWSDGRIAEMCQVSQPFVSSVRSSLITVMSEKSQNPRQYVNKHGTTSTMTVPNAGREKRELAPKTDRFGVRIPDALTLIFGEVDDLNRIMLDVSAMKYRVLNAIKDGNALYGRINSQRWQADCENLHRALRFAQPYCVCRMCQGEPPAGGCKACRDTGWQTEGEHDAVVPELRGVAK